MTSGKYYDSPKDKICERGCGIRIIYKGRIEEKKGSTGYFEYDKPKIEHTYARCDRIIKENKEREKHGSLFPIC
jgi:hypothetical protein